MPAHLVTRRGLLQTVGLTGAVTAAGLVVPTAAHATLTLVQVQQALHGMWWYNGAITRVFDAATKTAVTKFQSDRGLKADGIPNPATQDAIQTVVRAVQRKVGVTADGFYGTATKTAVHAYQKRHGLPLDGRAGATTMKHMGIARKVGGSTWPAVDRFNAPISRSKVIARAMTWVNNPRTYSMEPSRAALGLELGQKWRPDCSGFTSMAWAIQDGYEGYVGRDTTGLHPQGGLTYLISKSALKPGDIMLITKQEYGRSYGHVAIFEKWLNAEKTKYMLLEQTKGGTDDKGRYINGTVRRTMGWRYSASGAKSALYKPYRYKNIVD